MAQCRPCKLECSQVTKGTDEKRSILTDATLMLQHNSSSVQTQHPLARQVCQVVLMDIQHPQSDGCCQTYLQCSYSDNSLFESNKT